MNTILKKFCTDSKNLKKLGKWALVTGGSDGIGLGTVLVFFVCVYILK